MVYYLVNLDTFASNLVILSIQLGIERLSSFPHQVYDYGLTKSADPLIRLPAFWPFSMASLSFRCRAFVTAFGGA